MARFEAAIRLVLKHEGGYVNDPADPGGETKYGISKRSYPGVDIKRLTLKQAKAIYRRDFWRYGGIRHQQVATKVLDLAVNMGPPHAHRLLQRALRRLRRNVVIDGIYGPQTRRATNRVDPQQLLAWLRALAAHRYARIVLANPPMKKFLLGWMKRAVS